MDRAAGVLEKLERSRTHIRELDAEVQRFLDRDPYLVIAQHDSERSLGAIRIQSREQPPLRFGAIAGDAIHNLRSALDLAIYQLVCAHGNRPTARTEFPIATNRKKSESALKGGKVKGVQPEVIRLLKDLKPYNRGNPKLWRIHRLDITDKHHVLIPSMLITIRANFGAGYVVAGSYFQTEMHRDVPGGVVRDGTILGTFPIYQHGIDEVYVNPDFAFDVAFGEPQIVKGDPMVSTLVSLANYTESILQPFIRLLA